MLPIPYPRSSPSPSQNAPQQHPPHRRLVLLIPFHFHIFFSFCTGSCLRPGRETPGRGMNREGAYEWGFVMHGDMMPAAVQTCCNLDPPPGVAAPALCGVAAPSIAASRHRPRQTGPWGAGGVGPLAPLQRCGGGGGGGGGTAADGVRAGLRLAARGAGGLERACAAARRRRRPAAPAPARRRGAGQHIHA